MSRVLVVLRYGPPGSPHDQQRGAIYEPLFRAAGIAVRYVARYPISAMGWGQRPGLAGRLRRALGSVARARVRRALDTIGDRRIARLARDADVVVLVKVDSLALIRRLRRETRARLVYDLADVKHAKAREIDLILGSVDAVTVDNPRGFAYARAHNEAVHLWPPLAYVERFDAQRSSTRRGRDGDVVIGWIGSPSTASDLGLVQAALEAVSRAHPNVRVRLVGMPDDHEIVRSFEHVRATSRLAYDAESMVREVLDMDIGLFPMHESEDAAMHGTTKALIYMGGGAVALCSAAGEIPTLVRDGENGLLAASRAEWTAKLDALVRDAGLRERLAEGGLRTVRSANSLDRCFAQLRVALGV